MAAAGRRPRVGCGRWDAGKDGSWAPPVAGRPARSGASQRPVSGRVVRARPWCGAGAAGGIQVSVCGRAVAGRTGRWSGALSAPTADRLEPTARAGPAQARRRPRPSGGPNPRLLLSLVGSSAGSGRASGHTLHGRRLGGDRQPCAAREATAGAARQLSSRPSSRRRDAAGPARPHRTTFEPVRAVAWSPGTGSTWCVASWNYLFLHRFLSPLEISRGGGGPASRPDACARTAAPICCVARRPTRSTSGPTRPATHLRLGSGSGGRVPAARDRRARSAWRVPRRICDGRAQFRAGLSTATLAVMRPRLHLRANVRRRVPPHAI